MQRDCDKVALFERVGFLCWTVAMCRQNFAAAISIAAACLAALVLNRSLSRKDFVLGQSF
jgi:hypothetical protein